MNVNERMGGTGRGCSWTTKILQLCTVLLFTAIAATFGEESKKRVQIWYILCTYIFIMRCTIIVHIYGWHCPGRIFFPKAVTFFSVTRRSRSDESHSLTHSLTNWLSYWALALTLLMWPWWVMIPTEDSTDTTLMTLMTLITDESYLVMKVT